MLERPGGRLERGGRDAHGPVLRQYDAVRPERVRATDQSAEVLRIGDAVENEKQRRVTDAGEQLLQLRIPEFGQLGPDALVYSGARAVCELSLPDVLDAHSRLRRRLGDTIRALRSPPFLPRSSNTRTTSLGWTLSTSSTGLTP